MEIGQADMVDSSSFLMNRWRWRQKAKSLDETTIHSAHSFLFRTCLNIQTRDDSALQCTRSPEIISILPVELSAMVEITCQKIAGPTQEESTRIAGCTHLRPETDFYFHMSTMHGEFSPVAPLTPFETSASVPFKWEDEPGKPKQQSNTSSTSHPHLQLPPRLHARSKTPVSIKSSLAAKTAQRHSNLTHVFHSLFKRSRSGSATMKNKRDEKCMHGQRSRTDDDEIELFDNPEGWEFPESMFHSFDAIESQGSSYSPTDLPSSSSKSLNPPYYGLHAEEHPEFSSRARGRFDIIFCSPGRDHVSLNSSPSKGFSSSDGMKASSRLLSAVQGMKEFMGFWNRRGAGAASNKRNIEKELSACSDELDPTLAADNYTLKCFNDQMTWFEKPEGAAQRNINQTFSSYSAAVLSSDDEISSLSPLKFKPLTCRRKRSSQRLNFQKIQRSFFLFVTWKFMKRHRLAKKKHRQC